MGLHTAKEKISELEATATETTQNETQRKKDRREMNGAAVSCGATSRGLIHM